MPYAYLTYSAAATALASRLQDPSLVYFNQPNQLLNIVVEAARLLQALTGSYKQKITFNTQPNVNYYPLSSASPAALANTATDVEVIQNVLATLLEPPLTGTGSGWVGTGQFTFAQLQTSLQNRLNRFIGDTGRGLTRQVLPGPAPPVDLVALPDATLDLRRAAWLLPPSTPATTPPQPGYPLGRLDEWAEQAYVPGWSSSQAPQPFSYSVYGVPPQTFRLIPPPNANGSIDCILLLSGPAVNLNPAAPVVLGVSDDVSAGLKYGVLADLLGTDGPSRDYARAAYCEQRYTEYVQIARMYPSVYLALINEQVCGLGSVFDMDAYQPDWQQTAGVPSFVGMAGRHLACIGQTPDDGTAGGNPAGNYSVSLWTVANMPVSFTAPSTTYIQLGRDLLDPMLDYAQHVASLQMGGAEFDGTTRLFQNLIAAAKAQNGRLDAVAFYKGQLDQPANKSEILTQRMRR